MNRGQLRVAVEAVDISIFPRDTLMAEHKVTKAFKIDPSSQTYCGLQVDNVSYLKLDEGYNS